MRARFLTTDHRAARVGGSLAIAFGVGLLALAVTSGEVDDGGSTDVAGPTTESTEATVLGEVIERTTLPDAPPASAVGFTTTTTSEPEDGTTSTAPPPTIGSPTSTTPPPTIGPPTSITRPPPTTSSEPACSDGKDNDADGRVDVQQDPGCNDPFDDDEAT